MSVTYWNWSITVDPMVTHDFDIMVFVNTDSFVCSLINEYQWITVPYKYMFDHWYTTCDIFWCSVIYSDVQSWHIHHKAARRNNLSTNGVIFFFLLIAIRKDRKEKLLSSKRFRFIDGEELSDEISHDEVSSMVMLKWIV